MRDEVKTSEQAGLPAPNGPGAAPSAARRAMLLKSLGRGTAAVVVAAPIKTFAQTTTLMLNGRVCSISGQQSGTHSQFPNPQPCGGLSPGAYAGAIHHDQTQETSTKGKGKGSGQTRVDAIWPASVSPDDTFRSYFTGAAGGTVIRHHDIDSSTTLADILLNSTETDEFHWVCAFLNATHGTMNGYGFPYSPSQIVAFYSDTSIDTFSSLPYYQVAFDFVRSLEGLAA